MMLRHRNLLAGAGILVLLVAFVAMPRLLHWVVVQRAERLLSRELPPVTVPNPNPNPNPPPEVNLPVPFTPQAPHGNWDMPYQEACEEAAVLMAIRYAFSEPIRSPEDADTAIRELVRINAEVLGYSPDQNAGQVARLLRTIDSRLQVRLIRAPSVDLLRRELAAGNVVIVPAAGRKLKNPFFRRPGPRYHMLVLRGYTEDGYFLTNDPGTKRGEGYLYPFDRVMDAMHEWPAPSGVEGNGVDVERGEKIVIVVEPLPEQGRILQ